MPSPPAPTPDSLRDRIAARVRALRQERGWSQAGLARHLGLSQPRLSEIERGGGSFTAEQLLILLDLFNVPIGEFLPPTDPDDALQNALIQLGATHLRQVPGVPSPTLHPTAHEAILATLLGSRAPRLVTALAPVLLQHHEDLSLPSLRDRLTALGRERRLGWLLENVRDALAAPPPGADASWRRRAARATVVLSEELAHFPPPSGDVAPDLFDATIRSERSRNLVWEGRASPLSRRWGVVSELQPDDFRHALWSAHGPG
jgi:transcriptional regulator with XRE-family HTH domain